MATINQPDQPDYLLERRRLVPLIKCGIEKLESIVHKLESDIVPKSCPQSALSCLEKESEEKCLASKRSRHPAQESREVLPAQCSATTEFRPGTSAARCSIHRLSRGRCVLWSVLNRIVWKLLWAVSYSGHIHSCSNAGCLWDRGTGLLPAGWRFCFLYESCTALPLSCRLIDTQECSISCNRHLPYHILRQGGERRGREGGVSQSSNASSADDAVSAITALPVWPRSKTHRAIWNGNTQLFSGNHVQVLHPVTKPLFPSFFSPLAGPAIWGKPPSLFHFSTFDLLLFCSSICSFGRQGHEEAQPPWHMTDELGGVEWGCLVLTISCWMQRGS